jgi:hypothetical protein
MKRNIKYGSGIYFFLEQRGLLESSSPNEIEIAKKEYWKLKRNQYKQQKRKSCKAFTIFYDKGEYKIIEQQAKRNKSSITNYIKQQSLCTSKNCIDKKIIGQIRESLFDYYNALQSAANENQISAQRKDALTTQFEHIEILVMKALRP